MAYTVTPTFNQVTGEQADTQVSVSLHNGEHNTVTEQLTVQDEAFEPFEQQSPMFDSLDGDKKWKVAEALLTSGKQLTGSEVSFIQQQIFDAPRTDDEQRLARQLDARVTGNTNSLLPDDFNQLGLDMPNPDTPTAEQIDSLILGSEVKPDAAIASRVLNTNIGRDNASVVVQYLTHQVFEGKMSAQQAYGKAFQSGIPHADLYAAFNRLQEGMN